MKKTICFLAFFFAMVLTAQAQKLCGTWQQRVDSSQDGYVPPNIPWQDIYIVDDCTTNSFTGHHIQNKKAILDGEITNNGTVKMVLTTDTGYRCVFEGVFTGKKTLKGTFVEYQDGRRGGSGDAELRVLE